MNVEIIPSEKLPAKNREMNKKLPPFLPPAGSLVLIQGSAGSGKSSLLYSMLKAYQKSVKGGYWNIMIFYNACSDSDFVWRGFESRKTSVEVEHQYKDEELLATIEMIMDEQEGKRKLGEPLDNILFVFDDMIYSNICRSHGRPSALDKLVINRRHYNVSIFITSQTYHALNKNIRCNNVSQVIIMRANMADLQSICQDHNAGIVNFSQFLNMYNKCKAKDNFQPMVIDYREPQDRIFKSGFEEVLNPNEF